MSFRVASWNFDLWRDEIAARSFGHQAHIVHLVRSEEMKLGILSAALSVTAISAAASATVYNDPTGDMFYNGLAHLDLTSIEVTNTASDITFKISVAAAAINTPDWGKYQVGIDTNPATGDFTTPAGNPWGRIVSMSGGMDGWIGSWVDGGGGSQSWINTGTWAQTNSAPVILSGNSTTMTFPLASLGLTVGQTFLFDVYATGGGADGANDAASIGTQASSTWNNPFQTQGGLSYTIVPEPTTLGLLAGASVLVLRRRK